MESKKVEVEVCKEIHEIAEALAKIAVATKAALKDGFQAGQDLPVIVTEAFVQLPKAIEGLDKLDDEAKAQPGKFAMGLVLPLAAAVEEILKK